MAMGWTRGCAKVAASRAGEEERAGPLLPQRHRALVALRVQRAETRLVQLPFGKHEHGRALVVARIQPLRQPVREHGLAHAVALLLDGGGEVERELAVARVEP